MSDVKLLNDKNEAWIAWREKNSAMVKVTHIKTILAKNKTQKLD